MIVQCRARDVQSGSVIERAGTFWQVVPAPIGKFLMPMVQDRAWDAVLDLDEILNVLLPDPQPPRAPADEVEAIMNLAAAGFTVELIEEES